MNVINNNNKSIYTNTYTNAETY